MRPDVLPLDGWEPDRRAAVLQRILDRIDGRPTYQNGNFGERSRPDRLGPKDLLVLRALSHGLDQREAAVVLGMRRRTIEIRLQRVRRILGAKTTAQAVAIALRRGLII